MPRDIHVMTDNMVNLWDRPTKEHIVRLPYEISFQLLYIYFSYERCGN